MTPYAYALKLLTRRNYFEAELKSVLLEKFPDEDPEGAIASLKESRYIDDDRVLRSFIRWQIDSGHGQHYIREKLRMKGVTASIQQITTIAIEEELSIDDVIRRLALKYIKGKRKLAPSALTRSCMNYLAARGFEFAASLKIIKEVTEDESDFFEGC
ncbi:MAG: recombination regulator RecX [Deferribacteraceae bacterium]|jgi:SOS response regulatory protein OraA/RecX|nr:recombination regulator RecX [Deferribacteraceae bacterium]